MWLQEAQDQLKKVKAEAASDLAKKDVEAQKLDDDFATQLKAAEEEKARLQAAIDALGLAKEAADAASAASEDAFTKQVAGTKISQVLSWQNLC